MPTTISLLMGAQRRMQKGTSVAVVAEISLKSPQKIVIFFIKKYFYRIKYPKIKVINFYKNFTEGNTERMW